MTGMEDSDRSAVSRAFRSAADIRKATTKCHAPRHILYFQNESTHFTHPPFTDNVERYLIENVISTTPPPLAPFLWYKSKHDAVRLAIVPDNETNIMSGENGRETELKTNKKKKAGCLLSLAAKRLQRRHVRETTPVTVTYFQNIYFIKHK